MFWSGPQALLRSKLPSQIRPGAVICGPISKPGLGAKPTAEMRSDIHKATTKMHTARVKSWAGAGIGCNAQQAGEYRTTGDAPVYESLQCACHWPASGAG
ncbi:hypothetical protein Mag101_08525 [Microbulbifer agarilyticus]|uniref:Uncharacterized protein n=1 Tax=Microbulbifer agarilyticus TaxID=260552 RepID=A0A1Q2M4U6_9GAMM|nr:hypothetical protein Mag101_08525 [Microbulbifer agarilyticus]